MKLNLQPRKPTHMNKKHFELIAEIIRNIEYEATRKCAAQRFARRLRAEFPKFNATRFYEACGVQED